MPVFVLKIKCELDNVASMQADENNKWILTMQSPDEGERREHVEVTKARNEELEGSRGTANFVVKWQGAKKQATASIVEIKKVTTNGLIKGEQSGEFVPVLALDCRGLEPIEWHPSTDFAVTSEGGTVYGSDAVDLNEEEWTEYCEKSSAPVSIMEIEHKFEVA